MTLDEFIESVPKELRLGQHFYNQYFYKLKPGDNLQAATQRLYNTTCEPEAKRIIIQIMGDYQWEDLP